MGQSCVTKQEAVPKPFTLEQAHHIIKSQSSTFKALDSFEFNIFQAAQTIGRSQLLPTSTVYILQQLKVYDDLNSALLHQFLVEVQQNYLPVEYHNDLHAIDVMQMNFIMLNRGLLEIGQFNSLDLVSLVISSICHDMGHDGMTNAYHINSMSDRALLYNDRAVQENYHVSQSFKILLKHNFLNYDKEQFQQFRKRFIGIILATDMARHNQDFASFQALLAANSIKQGSNAEKIIDPNKVFDSQQQLMEILVHAADVSTQTRPFEIAKEWTNLLYQEFFHQGDLELAKNLPISFNCNRLTTQIPNSQPGFLNFVLIPLFRSIADLLPQMQQLVIQSEENSESWKMFVEDAKWKLIYQL